MPLFYSVNFPSLSQAKGQMAELQAQVCPSLSQFVPVCLKLKVKWLNYKLKQMADQGEGLSISSWVGELDRVALTSEADS